MALDESAVIAEIIALRACITSLAARLSTLSEMGNEDLRQIHAGAIFALEKIEISGVGQSAEAIRSRAEAVIDQVLGSSDLTIRKPS